jgi:hypothetical protein
MPAVNWDQPSTGSVSDPNPALALKNDKGGALWAKSEGVTIEADSQAAEALVARTKKTLTARIRSDESFAVLCTAPKATAAIGVNQSRSIAVGGVNLADPAAPPNTPGGIGVAGMSTAFAAFGVVGVTFGGRSTGVWGDARGGGVGVLGSGSNAGVEGQSPQGDGVQGFTQSDRSWGVYGFGPGVQGGGVAGRSVAGAGADGSSQAGPGVRGTSDQAEGVIGVSQGNSAPGVAGRNDKSGGIGVDGFSQNGTAVRATTSKGIAVAADSFSGMAVKAHTFSTTQPAVEVKASLSTGVDVMSGFTGVKAAGATRTGVSGTTLVALKPGEPEVGCGVYGLSLMGAGVCGTTFGGTGVLGVGHPVLGAWAGRFEGNVHISGMLFKSVSLFSIDHPLDPKRKVLNHASVEAPEYKTFYDGAVVLSAKGEATVKLPRWFDALNHELRYQLTAIGRAAPGLHVAREYARGSFAIAGGAPRQKVCWQVTAVRRDAWAKANPLVVEQPRAKARAAAPPLKRADIERAAAEARRQVKLLQESARAAKTPDRGKAPSAGRSKREASVPDAGAVDAARDLLRQAQQGLAKG